MSIHHRLCIVIVACVCGLITIPATPSYAQACFAIETAIDHATQQWDIQFENLSAARLALSDFYNERDRWRQQHPLETTWPPHLKYRHENDLLEAVAYISYQMTQLESIINDLLEALEDCENPPDCDGGGSVHIPR